MATIAKIAKEKQRAKTVAQYKNRRDELKKQTRSLHSTELSFEDFMAAVEKLQKQPRNASKARQRRRCRQCGRPHGVYRKFGLCRLHLREAMMRGDVTGLVKASW